MTIVIQFVLLVMLLLLVLALLHLAHKSASASVSRPRRLLSHFTIPTLSRFTSVVQCLSFIPLSAMR
ncbi:hypothetical protein B0H12DRAFT_1123986, partial [Mycena haematopus]